MRSNMTKLFVLLFLLVIAVSCTAEQTEEEYKIFFVSYRDEIKDNWQGWRRFDEYHHWKVSRGGDMFLGEVYSMNPDGSDQTRLTYNKYIERELTQIDSGERIYLSFSTKDGPDVGYLDYEGGDIEPLVYDYDFHRVGIKASSDGKKIVFISYPTVLANYKKVVTSELILFNPETEEVLQVTDNSGGEDFASITPDGSTIYFVRKGRGEDEGLYAIDTETHDEWFVSNGYSRIMSFSPDNRFRIRGVLFVAGSGTSTFKVYNTESHEKIAEYGGGDGVMCYKGKFSPDGSGIAIKCTSRSSLDNSDSYIAYMDILNNFETYRLTPKNLDIDNFAISPDGYVIYFTGIERSEKTGNDDDTIFNYNIYRINYDGSDLEQLTDGEYGEEEIIVSPYTEYEDE